MEGAGAGPTERLPARLPAARRWILTVAATLVLAASGLLYTRIGVAGLFQALTFSGRAIGAVIFACALVILGGAGAIGLLFVIAISRRKLSPAATSVVGGTVVAGAATLFVLSLVLFLIQGAALNFSAWLALWAALAAAAAVIFWSAIRARLPAPNIKGLAGGLSVGLLLSLASFVYSDFYLPSSTAPLLTVAVSIGKASIDQGTATATVPVSVTIRNQQTVGVYILASYLDVAGRSFTGTSPATPAAEAQAAEQGQPYQATGDSYSYNLIEENPLDGGGGFFLNPNESFTASDAVTVSTPTTYDAIQASYRLIIMRDDRFEVSDYSRKYLTAAQATQDMPAWAGPPSAAGPGVIAWSGQVYADSYLLNKIDPSASAYVWHQLPPSASPQPYFPSLMATICPPGDLRQNLTDQQILARQNLYGLQREGGGEPTTVVPAQIGIPSAG